VENEQSAGSIQHLNPAWLSMSQPARFAEDRKAEILIFLCDPRARAATKPLGRLLNAGC